MAGSLHLPGVASRTRTPSSVSTFRAALEGARSSDQDRYARALDVAAVVLPAVSFVHITVGGRLLLTELLFLALLPWLLMVPGRLRVPRWFVILWAVWLAAQILSDIILASEFVDFARGWATIVFTLINLIAIGAIASTFGRARLFAVGLAVGGVATYFLEPGLFPPDDPWKWAFAVPAGLVLATALSGPRTGRLRWLAVLGFGAFGALNLLLGYRSLGGVALFSAGYLVLNGLVASRSHTIRPSVPRALGGVLFGAVMAWTVLAVYDFAAAEGVLGRDAQTKHFEQSGSLGVIIGGRYEALVSTQAIIDSPLIGHGSWAKDFKYVDLLLDRLGALGYDAPALPEIYEEGLIPTHSYLLGAGVQAGLLGSVFWIAVGLVALWLLLNLYAVRLTVAPLLIFSTTLLLWSIAFSPYANAARLTAPYAIVLCILGLRAIRQGQGSVGGP